MTEREKNALEELGQRRLPAWEELPDLALYMDQVLSLTARYLPGLSLIHISEPTRR